jgi:SPP1 family predicted phage head-tail adaptor
MYLNAGDLDQYVTLQQRAAGNNAHGQAAGAWVNVFTNIRARVDTRPGADRFAAGLEHASSPVTFRIRYREGVHERMRVLWRGVVHEVVGQPVDVKGAGVAIDITAVAGLGDGA